MVVWQQAQPWSRHIHLDNEATFTTSFTQCVPDCGTEDFWRSFSAADRFESFGPDTRSRVADNPGAARQRRAAERRGFTNQKHKTPSACKCVKHNTKHWSWTKVCVLENAVLRVDFGVDAFNICQQGCWGSHGLVHVEGHWLVQGCADPGGGAQQREIVGRPLHQTCNSCCSTSAVIWTRSSICRPASPLQSECAL